MCTSLSLPSSSSSSSPSSVVAAGAVVAAADLVVVLLLVAVVVVGWLSRGLPFAAPPDGVGVEVVPLRWPLRVAAAVVCGVVVGWVLGAVVSPLKKLAGVVGAEAEAPFAPAQESSTGEESRLGISLPLRRTELKNFSAVLRSLKVISVEAGVVWMSVNSPMP